MNKFKTVFALNEDGIKKRNIAIKNMNNLLKDLGPDNVQIELVAYADAVPDLYLKNSEFSKQLEELNSKGITLAVCANTLKDKNISPDQLLPFIQVVSSAVSELTKKQAEGWSYIKI